MAHYSNIKWYRIEHNDIKYITWNPNRRYIIFSNDNFEILDFPDQKTCKKYCVKMSKNSPHHIIYGEISKVDALFVYDRKFVCEDAINNVLSAPNNVAEWYWPLIKVLFDIYIKL